MTRRLAITLAAALVGCEGDVVCEENVGAQLIEERVEVVVADQTVSAELADDPVERERGWRKRACDREGILLRLEDPGPLPVWGCELTDAIDVIGIHDGSVVYVEPLEPCGPPCGGCRSVGEGVTVDAVLEVPSGALEVREGDPANL